MYSSCVVATKLLTAACSLSTFWIFRRIGHCWAVTFFTFPLHLPSTLYSWFSSSFLNYGSDSSLAAFPSSDPYMWVFEILVWIFFCATMVSVASYIYGLQISWTGPLTVMVLIGTHVFTISRFPPATRISSELLHLIEYSTGIAHNHSKQFKTGHLL